MVIVRVAVAVVVALVVALALAPVLDARARAVPVCAAHVHHDVLPVWMRGGFTGANPRVPYELGKNGLIGAVLFASPLNSPPAKSKNNKILWVARHPARGVAALWIRMQKMDGATPVGAPVRRIISNGPGPSYVDAPSAGCWRLTLTWSGRQDTLDLQYVPPVS